MELLLGWAVWYLSFVHPVVLGCRLLRGKSAARTPDEVTDLLHGMVLLWTLSTLDAFILEVVIKTRVLLLAAHFVAAIYTLHFGGAAKIRHLLIDPWMKANGDTIEHAIREQIERCETVGPVHYLMDLYQQLPMHHSELKEKKEE